MKHIQSFPTISDQFRTRQTDWRDRREQTTPVLNKILDNLEKKENWYQQHNFLMRCQDVGTVPRKFQLRNLHEITHRLPVRGSLLMKYK